MGAPELPNDPGDDDLHTAHIIHPPAPSDDSDNDLLLDDRTFDGYQPLGMEEIDFGHIPLEAEDESNRGDSGSLPDREYGEYETMNTGSTMPKIDSVDAEIEREVWNQPRPLELQIELDGIKTQQILSAMASFQLPNLAVPDWAAGVPEERWKEELLERIRQRNSLDDKVKMEVDRD